MPFEHAAKKYCCGDLSVRRYEKKETTARSAGGHWIKKWNW